MAKILNESSRRTDVYQSIGAEFVGSALLLAIVVGSGIMGERLAGGNEAIALLANSLATGCGLAVLIAVLGPISGAHFNPVVTLVEALDERLPWSRTLGYVLAQVAGSIVGVVLAHAMFDLSLIQHATKIRTGANLWLAEGVATFGLVAIVILLARRNANSAPWAVAAWIVSAYWFTASTSFANPAVTLARSFTDTFCGIELSGVVAFGLAQSLGAALAWFACRQMKSKPRSS